MKNKAILLIIIVFLGSFATAMAQVFPNYKERTFSIIKDSLMQNTVADNNNIIVPALASDGGIDPKEYMIGPGDKLFISINGIEEVPLHLAVNQEGALYIPKVGIVNLNNTLLDDAKGKITAAINKYYKNVDVYISLVGFRKIKVSLLGDVNKPSSFVLPGNSRLMDLIVASNGLTETSNYRNITILDKEGDSNKYDFLSYLRFGDKKQNPLLNEESSVIIDEVDKVVSINGEVKFPGVYEFIEDETCAELIKLAGGLTSKARKDTIEVVSFDAQGRNQVSNYYSYTELLEKKIPLKNQDQILVREIPEYYIDRYVKVEGYVRYPGYYKIMQDKTTLFQVIKEAGGFLKDASLAEATVTRSMGTVDYDPEYERLKNIQRADMTDDEYDYLKAKSRQRKGRVVVDFVELFQKNDTTENVILKKGDVIDVPEAKNYIILLGQVVNPGNVIYKKNLSIEDYINLAGGFGWRAEKGNVRVIKANTGEWIDAEDVDFLKPGDTIWVPESPPGPKFWTVFTTSLQIIGQVASIIAATVAIIVASR